MARQKKGIPDDRPSLAPKDSFKEEVKVFLMVTLAAGMLAFNLRCFVNAGGLFPGGFGGITLLIQEIGSTYFNVSIPYSVPYILFNIIPAYIGFRYIGKRFTLWSFYGVVLYSILSDIVPVFHITEDPLLASIFGGVVGGASVGLCLMAGACAGGMDFISIYRSEKKGVDSWNFILAINAVILLTAGILFGFDRALYSIIYQFCSTQIIQMIHKRYQKDTMLIVTDKPMEVYAKIKEMTHHDATLLEGTGCYEGNLRQVLYSVIGRGEITRVVKEVHKIDEHAFVNVLKTEQINGRFYRFPTR